MKKFERDLITGEWRDVRSVGASGVGYLNSPDLQDLVKKMEEKFKIRNVITTEYLEEAVAYIRYSDHNQDGGISLEYQINEVLTYTNRNKIRIVGWYIDTAKSAREVAGRDDFIRLFNDVDKNNVPPNLIIFATNRAFRNNSESNQYREILRKNGVTLHSATQNLDDKTSSGRLHINMLSSIDQYQSETISDFVSAATKYLITEGFFAGGIVPFGYQSETTLHNGKERVALKPYEPEAAIVREMFDSLLAGKNLNQISRDFKAKGYKTRIGKPFQYCTLLQMSKNLLYIGERVYKMKNGDIVHSPNYCKPIVSKDVFNKANEMREENKKKTNGRERKFIYPLTGKLVCGDCGTSLVGTTSNGHSYYLCQAKYRQQKCCAKRIQKPFLDEATFDAVREHILSDKAIEDITKAVLSQIKKPSAGTESKKDLEARRAILEKEVADVAQMRIENKITESVMVMMIGNKNNELNTISKKLDALKMSIDPSIDASYIKKHIKAIFNKNIPFDKCDGEMLKELFTKTVNAVEVSNTQVVIYLRIPFSEFTDKVKSGNPLHNLSVTIEKPITKTGRPKKKREE